MAAAPTAGHVATIAERDEHLLFRETEHYGLVDALPYIDTQLGSAEVAQQVKDVIDQEMAHFEPRDYLANLPMPDLPLINSDRFQTEFARIEAGEAMGGVDVDRYRVEEPQGENAKDHAPWRRAARAANMQLEYNRLRLVNLEMLEKWGGKAWIAHAAVARNMEQSVVSEAASVKAACEDVNKKRKLSHMSCGNELRRLANELERYRADNAEVQRGLLVVEAEAERLRQIAEERGIKVDDLDPDWVAAKRARLVEEGSDGEA